jgi:hypothetical protein
MADTDAINTAMIGWLDSLVSQRPQGLDRLTDGLLEAVGAPPIPSRYRPGDSMAGIMEHAEAKTFGKLMAEHRSRQAWLAYGAADKAGDAAGMEEGHKLAKFWDYVAAWLDQQ